MPHAIKKSIKLVRRPALPPPDRAVSRRSGKRALTVGEVIAAAFDTVGTEVKDVAKLLVSRELACALKRRIVLV